MKDLHKCFGVVARPLLEASALREMTETGKIGNRSESARVFKDATGSHPESTTIPSVNVVQYLLRSAFWPRREPDPVLHPLDQMIFERSLDELM
jgi:hypothetical protein